MTTTEGFHFPKYRYKYDELILLEKFLKDEIKGQDSIINDFISVLKSNIIRTEDKPIYFILSGPSGVGKNLLVNKFSEFMSKINGGGFGIFQLDLSNFYVNELSSLYGTTVGFAGSDQPPLLYKHAENIYLSDDDYGNSILFFDEIDKLSKNSYTKDIYSEFFKNIMSTLSNRYQSFKGNSSAMEYSTVDMINTVIFISGNFINDERLGEFKNRIGFHNEEEINKNKEQYYNSQKATKDKLLEFFKSRLPISIFNRINSNPLAILQFNDISDEILYDIYKKEYNSLITKINAEMNYYEGFNDKFNKYRNVNKALFNEMKKSIDLNNGARSVANFVNNQIKLEIIENVVLPIKQKVYSNEVIDGTKTENYITDCKI